MLMVGTITVFSSSRPSWNNGGGAWDNAKKYIQWNLKDADGTVLQRLRCTAAGGSSAITQPTHWPAPLSTFVKLPRDDLSFLAPLFIRVASATGESPQ